MSSKAAGAPVPPRHDLVALAADAGVSLPSAFGQLQALYDEVDARNARNTAALDLPCHRGCSMCCHESVFLTALEFFYVWDYVQREHDDASRRRIVAEGLALYRKFADEILAMEGPVPEGERDHVEVARKVRFACPMLTPQGACSVYPVRELLARLFGCSFNDDGGVYGCHLVGAHLADKVVTLARARPTAQRLASLPLTQKRQVYPYWIHLLYGAWEAGLKEPSAPSDASSNTSSG